MNYISHYNSPIGEILLASDGHNLTGLWFVNQKYFAKNLNEDAKESSLEVFDLTKILGMICIISAINRILTSQ